jgi:hypothetical protein
MPDTQTFDLRPDIKMIVRELLTPLEEKIQQLERRVNEQQAEIEKMKTRS